jgi:hypothetical protein
MATYKITTELKLSPAGAATSPFPIKITIPVGSLVEGEENTKEGAKSLVFTYNGAVFHATTGYELAAVTTNPNVTDNIVKAGGVSWKASDFSATYILGSAGHIAGLVYAFKKEKKFWGYVGFFFLGGIAFGTLGGIIDYVRKDKK